MLRSSNLFLTTRNRGFVPSHGTGTYYKQGTLDEIHKRRGYIWDEKNFTEDFEISLYLYYFLGKTLFYIPYPYIEEYFPSSFRKAIRQMSRWSYGALQSLTKYFINIIRNSRNKDDLLYTSSFGLWSFSFLWWTSFLIYLVSISNISNVERLIYLFNTINGGIRYLIEVPILYEMLNLSDKRLPSFKRVAKNVVTTIYASVLGASSSSYMVYRYLLKRRKMWVKTEHK